MGGLAAALSLARRAEVTVLERAAHPGGKMRDIKIGGARIDIGPTVLTMKWVFDDLFSRAGADFDAEVPAQRLDCLARHGWRDGSRFDLLSDDRAAADAVGVFAGAEEMRGFVRFLADARRIYDMLRDSFLRAPAPDMLGMIASAGPLKLLKIDPFSTYWTALQRYFRDPRLVQLFGRYATYCGSSPFRAPATLMLIAAVEKAGVWAPIEGMAGLARAAARLAETNGARFRYGEQAAEVLTDGARVSGVRLSSGERIAADAVILNADAGAVAAGLLGAGAARAVPAVRARSQSAVTFTFAAAASGFTLDRHNVFFSRDYKAEFDAVFTQGAAPMEPTTYVWAPSPSGGVQPLFCLVNAPASGASFTAENAARARERMIDHLAACGLKLDVAAESAMTPAGFAQDYPGTDGAIYGAPSHGWRATFERSGVRTKIRGLYLAGGSVHPGAGVPMAALSGMAAATCLMNDFALT
jgi:1-hydroxycarotenoid 3,4-desaturase